MRLALLLAVPAVAVVAAVSTGFPCGGTRDVAHGSGQQAEALARSLSDRNAVPRPLRLHPLRGFTISPDDRRKLISEATRWCYLKSRDLAIRIHALRLRNVARAWGEAESLPFYDRLLRSMLDDTDPKVGAVFSILFQTPYGAGYRVQNAEEKGADAAGGITHVDKILSVMGELGFGLDTGIITHDGARFTLADVLEDSLKRSRPGREVEWSLIAYCDYLPRQDRWVTGDGTSRTVDDILEEVLRRQGACFGSHRLYALARAIQRGKRDPGFFGSDLMAQAESQLRLASERLTKSQRADGSWWPNWADDRPVPQGGESDALDPRLSVAVTGHMLEWFALAHDELRPPRDVIERSAHYVLRQLLLDPEAHFGGDRLAAVTHSVRGLIHLCDDPDDGGAASSSSH